MYLLKLHQSALVPTFVSFLQLLAIFPIFFAQFPSVSARNVHNHLLYTTFNLDIFDSGALDASLDEWAGVQGFWESFQSDFKPTASHQDIEPHTSGSPTHGVSPSRPNPTPAPLFDKHSIDASKLHRRDTFSSNVCPISVQTTIYISVDGTSTTTLSSAIGPRPTGIPGDTGTSTGTDPTGGQTGTESSGGQAFGNKEGLITGLIIVLLILLASFCALCTYFYKKRRNARIQRLSAQPHSDAADIVRRMGSKGLLSLSNSARSFSRSPRWLNRLRWSPVAFLSGLRDRFKSSSKRNPERDSQSSELLEWKRRMGQTERGGNAAWSVAGNSAGDAADLNEKHHIGVAQPTPEKRTSGVSIPEIISSPAMSDVKLPSPPKPAARLSTGEPIQMDYVPLVQRRVSPGYRPIDRLSALQPIAVEPVRLGSTTDLTRDTSPRRNSAGEPLSPSAWMAGFGLASGSNVDPFNNPSYVSSSDHHDSVQSVSKLSEPGSPLSNAPSSGSDRTPRGRVSPHRYNNDRLSAVNESADVSPDGASDIMSTFGSAFGDRPSSQHTVSTIDDRRLSASSQIVRYHPLSDVEEVLTPVADERLSMQPGSAPFNWRQNRDSLGQHSAGHVHLSLSPGPRSTERPLSQLTEFVDPFTGSNTMPSHPPPPHPRGRRPVPPRRKSEATSLQGGFLPSEKSASMSLTGTSIVDLGPPIDTGDWDDAVSRRREETQLFYTRPGTAASGSLEYGR